MRAASQTRTGITASDRPSASRASHVSALPSAMRTGMRSGEHSGTYDSHTTSGLSGAHGATDTPTMYGTTMRNVTGVVTAPTSSWRETSAPSAAMSSA